MALLCGWLMAGFVHADLLVPAGASVALNGGSSDLACSDLIVAGNLSVGSGSITGIRSVNVQTGGSIAVGSGTLSLSGNWSDAGTFAAGSGLVSFVDLAGCAPTGGTISGDTSFAQLSFSTSGGKTYQLASGSTQTITRQLRIQGAPGVPLVLRGTTTGRPAFLAAAGEQSTLNFGAADLTATGIWIAPNQTNAINGSGVSRIFGDPNPPVPALPLGGLALLALALIVTAKKMIDKSEQ